MTVGDEDETLGTRSTPPTDVTIESGKSSRDGGKRWLLLNKTLVICFMNSSSAVMSAAGRVDAMEEEAESPCNFETSVNSRSNVSSSFDDKL